MNIEIRSTVKLNLSADNWQLYGVEGREKAARELNRELEKRINNAATRSEFKWEGLLTPYSEYGASDSEGYHMVEHILNKVYGVEREY
jgi:hypothetical protein